MATTEQIADLVEPILRDQGHELYDVELTGATIRVLVDKEGGVDLGALETLSRAISARLDEADPLPARWYLEVSSPGLERPLRRPEHFARALGSTVKVKTHPQVEGERRIDGVLTSADDDGFTVETADGQQRRLRYDEIDKARTVFVWGPAGKTSQKRNAS